MRADTGNYWMEVELKSGERCKHVLTMQIDTSLQSPNGRANRPCFGGR